MVANDNQLTPSRPTGSFRSAGDTIQLALSRSTESTPPLGTVAAANAVPANALQQRLAVVQQGGGGGPPSLQALEEDILRTP